MSTNADALDAVKRARAERDAARARLYALELQRIAAEKAQRREQRGEGEIDPAVADEVRDLQAELVRLEEQLRKSDQGDVPRDERDVLERRRQELLKEIDTARARAGADGSADADARRTRADIAEQRKVVAAAEAGIRGAIDRLFGELTPQQLIERWDDALPIALVPLRTEVRWKTDLNPPQLWVRVYPDDLAVSTHEKELTDAEVTHGHAYWTARAATDDEKRTEAWRSLAERFGANRAAWVAIRTKPANWTTALGDATVELDFPVPAVTKPDAWTTAPHTRVLPDRLVLLGYRGGRVVANQVGARVDDVVVLGPSPLEDHDGGPSITRDQVDRTLQLGDSFRWIRDFDDAVQRGLGFRLTLDQTAIAQGFDQLLVLGLKLSADGDDAKTLVEDLLDDHHYSRPGLALLQQGTPTNNTDGNDTAYTRTGRTGEDSAVTEVGPPLFAPVDDRSAATDGQRLADYLGIGYEPLLHADGADLADHAEAVAMNRALYAGTLGYYLDHMLNEVVDEDALEPIRRHFTTLVTGRGPIAAVRVGSQPYGILVTSAFGRWVPTTPTDELRLLGGGADRFEVVLHQLLAELDAAWTSLRPAPQRVGDAGNGAAHLLDVLGLQPTSAELYQRVGYSYDYLKNLESFGWGGSDFGDVLKMMFEGMGARSLLRRLGYSQLRNDRTQKPFPLLLQLIWRHYHTRLGQKDLIDGQPLSETVGIKPYDPALGLNYLDWLEANGADAAKLEAHDFGGAAAPTELLYRLLHFSLLMEASRGIHRWLGARDVRADELVRSRKFVNIGADPSPSVWEVFKAPANRIVQSEPAGIPLLELLHAPQLADDEGQGLAEQRAGLTALRGLPTARLERALVEHLDTLTYRLDAWQTSLFERRLHRQRRLDAPVAERRTGVYLGAYGYLENVRPGGSRRVKLSEQKLPAELRTGADNLYENSQNGGYVLAPSLNHATAAALLRSGYLTHASPDDPDALAVNLSSDRVRRARYLLDGIRNGQSLEVLLGVAFERGLHDWTTRPGAPVILDQLKPNFRAAFPIRRTRVPQATDAGSGAAVVSEDHQVVNGLDLARSTLAFPYGVTGLPALSADQRSAIEHEKEAIENTLDSLRDVLTAEAAYQLALGNFDRAAAVVQSLGNGTVPPDVEVIRTPRGTGISFTSRLAVQLSPAETANPWAAVAPTERALLEPALNHWLGTLLGDPASVRCVVSAHAPDATAIPGLPLQAEVSLADLGLQPIDVVYITRGRIEESAVAEIEARIRYRFARAHGVPDAAIVRIAFGDPGAVPGARSFAETLALADRLRRLLGTSRPLDARHFQSASKDHPAPPDNPGRIDVAELRTRVGARLTVVRALFTPLRAALTAVQAAATPASMDVLRDALAAVARAGFVYALPESAVGSGPAQVEVLTRQAESVLGRFDVLGPATDDQLSEVDAAGGTAEKKVALLTDAVRAWLGADMALLPQFVFADPAAVTLADAARDDLLTHVRTTVGVPLPVDEWLHGAACVRSLVHNFELVRAIADARLAEPLVLSPLQLPYRAGDSWLGAEYPPTMEVVHDTVALVQHLPQGFSAAGPQTGLLIDEWTESVPLRQEVTGLTFNFDAPNSAPPQALLLAVTPEETGSWHWDDLVETIRDTFRRASLRAVEPDRIGGLAGIGTLLPAVVAEFSTSRASVSLDYSLVVKAVSDHVLAVKAAEARR
jgi:hypothetical protein